jgi:hypothetical protein
MEAAMTDDPKQDSDYQQYSIHVFPRVAKKSIQPRMPSGQYPTFVQSQVANAGALSLEEDSTTIQ